MPPCEVQGKAVATVRGTVAVTGATGRQGGAVARALVAAGRPVRALTRRVDSPAAAALREIGVAVVACDLGDPAALDHALAGAEALFLTTTPYEAGTDEEERLAASTLAAARRAGVGQVVYSSVAGADRPTPFAHFASKGRIEALLNAARFDRVTILRPVFFMDMFLGAAFRRGLARGVIEWAVAPSTRIAMVAVEDIAAFAALAFADAEGLNGAVVELAGDRPDLTGLAAAMSDALGQSIRYCQVAPAALDPEVKPRLATQRWCEAGGWTTDVAAFARAWPVPLTDIGGWARAHRAELLTEIAA